MRNIKPVYVMFDDGVEGESCRAVLSGIRDLLSLAGVLPNIEVRNFGVWRDTNWRESSGALRPFYSVDWYVERGRHASERRSQINAQAILADLWNEPWQKATPHYDVVVLSSDLNYGSRTNGFILGAGAPSLGAVVSTYRFRELDAALRIQCVKTAALHEVGHVFGLLPEARRHNVEESLGKHCTNTCVMRQGLQVPDDWIRFTRDRLSRGVLCGVCAESLKSFFR